MESRWLDRAVVPVARRTCHGTLSTSRSRGQTLSAIRGLKIATVNRCYHKAIVIYRMIYPCRKTLITRPESLRDKFSISPSTLAILILVATSIAKTSDKYKRQSRAHMNTHYQKMRIEIETLMKCKTKTIASCWHLERTVNKYKMNIGRKKRTRYSKQ